MTNRIRLISFENALRTVGRIVGTSSRAGSKEEAPGRFYKRKHSTILPKNCESDVESDIIK